MAVEEIMAELKSFGSESIKKILSKHGVKEPFFGVKIEYLKIIQKRIKVDYQIAKELYATGNADAMYLAGLITDDGQMTKADLQTWVQEAKSNNISEYTVPWVAAGSRFGFELALEWIKAKEEFIAAAGWSTLGNLAALKKDEDLDLKVYKELLHHVAENIHTAANRVRSTMNMFIISTGSYIVPLTDEAIIVANKIGSVTIDSNGTACKVPNAVDYIEKVKTKGNIGKKKKMVKC
jgi:3-methyladenine DNA glycosylase AlkD